jgi:hypothetical protein
MPRQSSAPQVYSAPNQDASGSRPRPVHTLRHRSIKAAIWRNQTEKGTMFNVTLSRSYRDENENWQETHSFGYDDLANVAALMYEAHSYIANLLAEESAANKGKSRR